MSPTAGWRLGPVRSLLPGPTPPRPMQGWLSPSPGLVPRTGLAAFGSRALGRCSFPWTPPSPPPNPRDHTWWQRAWMAARAVHGLVPSGRPSLSGLGLTLPWALFA